MQAALIVHELSESPEHFKDKGDGTISNGYYTVRLDGSGYGMGAAKYFPTQAEIEILTKAIDVWKKGSKHIRKENRPGNSDAMKKCIETIRKAHKAFLVHHEDKVLAKNVGLALEKYDAEGR